MLLIFIVTRGMKIIAFLFFILFFLNFPVHAYEFGINVHGLSYHPDRTNSEGERFREWNPGFGGRFIFSECRRHVWLAEAGLYSNSTGHVSKYVAGGYRFKLPAGFELGPSLALYQSPDQNSGKTFFAPLLVFSFRYKRMLFHVIPVPKYKEVNRNAAVGFYATVNLWKTSP